ncbi:chaplin [Streptomyces sp. ISL-94]|uniref:chaplin n=1 Tax=Streptomyces sp. ISL-94 TaxID=2819190 RepID=UPI001BE53A50|nr:chaplin [Streptomyces sp. ISL-94]MBT2479496.1 chaplin [Streptomyces sp. ISL-94]
MRQVLSRQVLGKGMLTAAAASSLLSIATGAAYAHSGATAEASHSPGVLAGNSVSVPVTFAPNVCGNSVDGGAALNPAMGNTCVNSTGSHTDDGYDYGRYLSPENAQAFERYLEERDGRHSVPEQRQEEPPHQGGYGGPGEEHPDEQSPEQSREQPREEPQEEPRHQGGGDHQDGYGGPGGEQGGEQGEEECDDHPGSAPPPPAQHAPPAPERPHPQPEPRPAPLPAPAPAPVEEAPAPPLEEQPAPAPVEEAPVTLPAPSPAPEAPAPVGDDAPAPRPPHGSRPVEHPAPAPADQPPAAPAGDVPIHLPPARLPAPAPAPAPAPVPAQQPQAPAPAHVTGPMLAETGAGQSAAAAVLASALILGGAILYRRSRIA